MKLALTLVKQWHIIINLMIKTKTATADRLLVCSFSLASITDVMSVFRRQQRFYLLFLLAAAKSAFDIGSSWPYFSSSGLTPWMLRTVYRHF